MPRKAKAMPPEEAPEVTGFTASVRIMEDGRVEALLQDDPDHPVRELIGRTSQPEAAKFIFNDLAPNMQDLIAEDN